MQTVLLAYLARRKFELLTKIQQQNAKASYVNETESALAEINGVLNQLPKDSQAIVNALVEKLTHMHPIKEEEIK